MMKGLAVGAILCSLLLLAEGSQQKPHTKESQFLSGLSQQKAIKIKDKTKQKSYPRGTIATH